VATERSQQPQQQRPRERDARAPRASADPSPNHRRLRDAPYRGHARVQGALPDASPGACLRLLLSGNPQLPPLAVRPAVAVGSAQRRRGACAAGDARARTGVRGELAGRVPDAGVQRASGVPRKELLHHRHLQLLLDLVRCVANLVRAGDPSVNEKREGREPKGGRDARRGEAWDLLLRGPKVVKESRPPGPRLSVEGCCRLPSRCVNEVKDGC
jgi:hypothetical protein